ncbi:MAG TPA: hypothetical protein VM513_04025 [Kofleriaceae bacterium]|jgi:hypothetical protein|nr:hypothetical protein [Kofleriaceae bacterium]
MRLGLALVVLCSCIAEYDPVDEIRFSQFTDTAQAVTAILDDAGPAKVYAVGEYHPTRSGTPSPLKGFTTQVLEQMLPRSRHLVVEAWTDTGCDGDAKRSQQQISHAIGRPPAQAKEIEALIMKSARNRLATHGLQMTCIERGALLDAMGRVDFLRLLELVTEKLHATTKALVSNERAVIVYGGALHNDLYPHWPLELLSYAAPLQRDLGGGVVEIDLIVPEVVAPLPMIRMERWFPLLGRSAPGRTLVWQRGPGSYVLILPAQSLEPAKVALPVATI